MKWWMLVLVVELGIQLLILRADERRMRARGWPVSFGRMTWVAAGQTVALVAVAMLVLAALNILTGS